VNKFEGYINLTTLDNAAAWHATMAMKAYRKKQWDAYRRHIKLFDHLSFPDELRP
jgi:hypothetical protein